MKLKILLLSLLLPFSSFGATNLFNDVTVNNTLTVFGLTTVSNQNVNGPIGITMKGGTGLFFSDSATFNQYGGIYGDIGGNTLSIRSYDVGPIRIGFGTSGTTMTKEIITISNTSNILFNALNVTNIGNTILGDSASDTVVFNASTAAISPAGLNFGSSSFIITNGQVLLPDTTVTAPAYSFISSPNSGFRRSGGGDYYFTLAGVNIFGYSSSVVGIASNIGLRFSSTLDPLGTASSLLVATPGSLGIIHQRAGTTPQGYRLFNTYTSENNNEYGSLQWTNNVFRIATIENGAGLERPMSFHINGANEVARFNTNGFFTVSSNMSSRAQAVVVGPNATTNSLLQSFTGTYAGAPAAVTFGIVFAAAPAVVVTTTETGGTALGNDTVWVTNVTTTGCTVGYRNGAGVDSSATITFNGLAFGLQ